MNWSTIEAKWNDYKGEAQKQWSKLTDEQINGTMGSRNQLSARLQQAYAVTEAEAIARSANGRRADGAAKGAAKH